MKPPSRSNGRAADELRPVRITPHFLKYAEGSALIEAGDTKVICSVSVEEKLPPFLKDKGEGWITSEYAMLPRATAQRNARESSKGKQTGRSMEIQRLVGRALRAACDMKAFGERTLWIDCDVIQADGGTRTAAITGSFVALTLAASRLLDNGKLSGWPIKEWVAAASAGRVDGAVLLDLDYGEDSRAEVDMNVIATEKGRFVEIQGTAERGTFGDEDLTQLLAHARKGIAELIAIQRAVLAPVTESLEKRLLGGLKSRFRGL